MRPTIHEQQQQPQHPNVLHGFGSGTAPHSRPTEASPSFQLLTSLWASSRLVADRSLHTCRPHAALFYRGMGSGNPSPRHPRTPPAPGVSGVVSGVEPGVKVEGNARRSELHGAPWTQRVPGAMSYCDPCIEFSWPLGENVLK